jgi:hypothetical protein
LKDIQTEISKGEEPRGTAAEPVVVASPRVTSLWGFPTWLGPLMSPLATAGLVIVMVIFMLLEREDLRNRLIGLIGYGHLAVTTKVGLIRIGGQVSYVGPLSVRGPVSLLAMIEESRRALGGRPVVVCCGRVAATERPTVVTTQLPRGVRRPLD